MGLTSIRNRHGSDLTLRVILFLSVLGTTSTIAQQVNVRNFANDEGLPQRQALTVHQDIDGYLWFGTYAGLSRFDGETFETFGTDDGLPSNLVLDIDESPAGQLIVAIRGGVCRKIAGGFDCAMVPGGEQRPQVASVAWAPGDRIWVATENGVFRSDDTDELQPVPANGLPNPFCNAVIVAQDGSVWVGTQAGLAYWDDDRFVAVDDPRIADSPVRWLGKLEDRLAVATDRHLLVRGEAGFTFHRLIGDRQIRGVNAVAIESGAETLWVATESAARRCDAESCQLFGQASGLLSDRAHDMIVDRENSVWFATEAGISQLVPGPFRSYTLAEGLPHPFVREVVGDARGRLWVGTRDGVALIEDGVIRTDLVETPGESRHVYAIAPFGEDGMLIGGRGGLLHWRQGSTTRFLFEPPADKTVVWSIAPDETGAWLGTQKGLVRFDGESLALDTSDPRLLEPILTVEPQGREGLWIAPLQGGLLRLDPDGLHDLAEIGVSPQTVWDIDTAADGSIWLATNGDGLLHIDGDDVRRWSVKDGLPNPFVWQVLCDADGNVWAYTNRGLARFRDGFFEVFDLSDGLIDIEGSAAAATMTADGHLWFGTGSGLHEFDPRLEHRYPPILGKVAVTLFDTFGVRVAEGEEVLPDRGPLELRVQVPSYRNRKSLQYRYRLRGLNGGWSEARVRDQISLAGLGPGAYRLDVVAADSAGNHIGEVSTLAFSMRPTLMQNNWIRALLAAALVGLIALAFWARLRAGHRRQRRLERIVEERTRELAEKNRRLVEEAELYRISEATRRELETSLQHAQKMEAIGRLAGGVAHDFNNLLTVIIGYSERLDLELAETGTSRQDLEQIQRASRMAGELTTKLLAFGRKQPRRPRHVDLDEVVEETASLVKSLLGDRIDLILTPADQEVPVFVDPSQIEQVLFNLATNGRDAMPDGGRLRIETQIERGGTRPRAALIVSDTGCGMTSEVREHALEPFFTTKSEGQGTGLGLSIVYGIATQNEGAIKVESEPGKGTRVEVRFPLSTGVPKRADEQKPVLTSAKQTGETILVAEDEPFVLDLICSVLRASGYRVLEASSGDVAIGLANDYAGEIHLVITDVVMPRVDGASLANHIAASRPETPVLFISGYAQERLGADGTVPADANFLAKPFDSDTLRSRVREMLDARDSRNGLRAI